MNTSPTARSGGRRERDALDFLLAKGLTLEARNFRCAIGEIDLVMREGDITVFVEVRYRRGVRHGGALASISPAKIRRVAHTAMVYLQGRGSVDVPMRFDVVAIDGVDADLRWVRSAFEF